MIIEALRNIQKYIYEAFKGIHKAFKGIQEHSRALKIIRPWIPREFKRGKQGVTFMRPKAVKDAQIDLYWPLKGAMSINSIFFHAIVD